MTKRVTTVPSYMAFSYEAGGGQTYVVGGGIPLVVDDATATAIVAAGAAVGVTVSTVDTTTPVTPATVDLATQAELDTFATTVAPLVASAVAPIAADVRDRRGVRRAGSVVYLGDSNDAINTVVATRTYGESVPSVATLLSRGRLLLVENAGVASNTVEQMLARLDADVIAKRPAMCVVGGGSNSTTKGAAVFITEQAAYVEIIRRLLAAGIEPVLRTIPPRDGSRTFTSAEPTYGASAPLIYQQTLSWNVFVRANAAKYRLRLIDVYALVTDPATGDYKAGWTADGVHFSQTAVYAIGQLVADTLATAAPDVAPPLARDRYSTVTFCQDPLFLGGAVAGSGGRFPAGFNGPAAAPPGITFEDPVNGDGLGAGKWLRMSKTGAASVNVNMIRTLAAFNTASGLNSQSGDRLSLAFPYKIENASGGGYVSVQLRFLNGSTDLKIVTPMSQFKVNHLGLCYVEDVIPATCDRIRLDFSFGAAGAIDMCIGQLSAYDLTAMGAPSLLAAS